MFFNYIGSISLSSLSFYMTCLHCESYQLPRQVPMTLQNQQEQFTLYRVTLALHVRSSVTWPYNLVRVTWLYRHVSIHIL